MVTMVRLNTLVMGCDPGLPDCDGSIRYLGTYLTKSHAKILAKIILYSVHFCSQVTKKCPRLRFRHHACKYFMLIGYAALDRNNFHVNTNFSFRLFSWATYGEAPPGKSGALHLNKVYKIIKSSHISTCTFRSQTSRSQPDAPVSRHS